MQVTSVLYSTLKELAATRQWLYCAQSTGYGLWVIGPSMCATCTITGAADITDFETNYKPGAVATAGDDEAVLRASLATPPSVLFRQPETISRFGNLTAAATAEVLVSARAYVEQSAQAQRSVVSTSTQDNPAGTGAKKVKITYLNSAYTVKTEEITLNGTTAVNTVATDIRFIEKFEVSQGAAAVGALRLMTAIAGGGSEFCGIGIGTYDAFLCHHYVPAGKRAWVLRWEATIDDGVKFKLIGRHKPNGVDLVDTHIDLINLMGITTPPGFLQFSRDLLVAAVTAQAYVRITAIPNQATSTNIRTHLYLWEESV